MGPKSDTAMLWRDLGQNLLAGARLALFVPVRPLDFRVSAAQCAALILVSFALWLAMGVLRHGFPGSVDLGALTAALAGIPILLGACLLAARLFGEARLAPAFAVVLVASDPAVLIVEYIIEFVSDLAVRQLYWTILEWLFLIWAFSIIVRTQYVLTGWRGRRSALVLVLFTALFAVLLGMAPRGELWVAAADDEDAPEERLTKEEVFHRQGTLLDERLAALAPERRGVVDLYFVGVAADWGQDTFYTEITSIKDVLDERFDTDGRSIVLVNNPATLTEYPIATVSNLRVTLAQLGNTINTDEDIVLLHLVTHGSSDYRLAFVLPPLELAQLTPSALARMLADSGIKWKVIVISACFAGGFIEPLKDDNTLVITAADAYHSSFGCAYDSDYTWFSEALYDEALRETFSFVDAFDMARKTVSDRERAEGYEPSNPQIAIGSAMRRKLAALEKRLAAEPGDPQRTRAIRVRSSDSSTVLVKGR